MWYEVIEKTEFLRRLYNKIPDLNNIEILEIQLCESGDRVKLSLFLPILIDNLPLKWKQLKYNSAIIDLELFVISSILLESKKSKLIADIHIEKTNQDTIILKCAGAINMEVCAEVGIIQEIRGCKISEMS
ncbi:immunity protein 50 of polymorphic toxin system [Lachnotalea glycerini]|uniref:Immunity protein 50 of polymorphic toxin system n=1 Tax=Lachnotalea glycerini TaxID=1763509 RepID=A0A318EL54_9FIRM|nr:Imm50 family immunity protein [Lachnotalea glycerini]OYO87016.1 hypothetical protein CG709_14430 [Lachnotalea glycerini]PXV84501.1 immunity protein 50 of polymorphic toxin system [Lachnotalea glycerini]